MFSCSLVYTAAISCLRHSFQVFLGLPLGLRPSASVCIIFLSGLSRSGMWPNQINLRFLITSKMSSRPHLLRVFELGIWSDSDTLQTILSIRRSQLCNNCSSLCECPRCSSVQDGIDALARCFRGTVALHSKLLSSLHLNQATGILCLTALSAPPSECSMAPLLYLSPVPWTHLSTSLVAEYHCTQNTCTQ